MSIFTLLGSIVDEMSFHNTEKIIYDKDTDKFIVEDEEIIGKYVLPLCSTFVEERYRVIENGEWYVAYLSFGVNPENKRGELQKVTFVNSKGDEVTVPVAQEIRSELCTICKDDTYYTLCEDILCQMA